MFLFGQSCKKSFIWGIRIMRFKKMFKLVRLLTICIGLTLPACLAWGASSIPCATMNCNVPDSHLSHWFAGGLNGKKIIFLGDSTTSNATNLFGELKNFYTKEGEGLYGIGIIENYGENGASLRAFLLDQVAHGITAAIAARADLYVISYGINDVRLGSTTEDELVSMLQTTVNRIRFSVPNADIVLRMPNSFLSLDINGNGFVKPVQKAPVYSTILRNAYKRLEYQWSNVALLDTQESLFGRVSPQASPYMWDQIHPSAVGYGEVAKMLVDLIGQKPPYDEVLAANALATNPSFPYIVYPRIVDNPKYFNLVATGRWLSSSVAGAPNGYIDFDWPGYKSGDILCGDVLQMAGGYVFTLPQTCMAIPLGQNTRIYNLGSKLPYRTITGGTINVFRKW
jgi:lysophospholipase L1-like esterase